MVGDNVADGRTVRVGFGVGDKVGWGLTVGLGVSDGRIVDVTRVGGAIVGGRVGAGGKYSSSTLHPVMMSNVKTKTMIFLGMI